MHGLAIRQPAESVLVYTSTYAGAAEFDAEQPFPVVRHDTGLLLPTPGVRRRVIELVREHRITAAWFGASAPLALLAPTLRRAGVQRIVASTHGHEVGWAMLPGARQALRRIGNHCDVVTYLADYTRRRLASALGPRANLQRLTPGVDVETFNPTVDGAEIRTRYGLADAPVVVCVSRLVARKGQDTLLRALPDIHDQVGDARLLFVGQGPYRDELTALARRLGIDKYVIFTGGVAEAELPAHYAAGDVFAMPCRTRRGGMDVEGLGIVYLEASASGLPVVAGDSGGAPDTVLPGQTGVVLDGRDVAGVAYQVADLLIDRDRARRLGQAGRTWVEDAWRWDVMAERLRSFLDG